MWNSKLRTVYLDDISMEVERLSGEDNIDDVIYGLHRAIKDKEKEVEELYGQYSYDREVLVHIVDCMTEDVFYHKEKVCNGCEHRSSAHKTPDLFSRCSKQFIYYGDAIDNLTTRDLEGAKENLIDLALKIPQDCPRKLEHMVMKQEYEEDE